MVKVNQIIVLRVLKITYYLLTFFCLATFLSIGILSFIIPEQPIKGGFLTIGTYESYQITSNILPSFHIQWIALVIYIFSVIFYVSSIVIFLLIATRFKFNSQRFDKVASLQIIWYTLLFILISIVCFNAPSIANNSYLINTDGFKSLNYIFDFKIENAVIIYKFASSGITIIFFFVLETLILLICSIIFSYNMIKNKYI